jgi:CubicO group peptidase (beta-lactamase class C family)
VRLAALVIGLLAASSAAADPLEYQTIAGASAEPITEGVGLRGKDELEYFLDGVMAAHLKAMHLAGATLAVVKDGELYFAKGYGYADVGKRVPVDADKTLFEPASISKLFTWTAVMQMVEQGKLKLDGDVNDYLTQFKIPDTYPQPITIKNLMTHTAGFEESPAGNGPRGEQDLKPLAETLSKHIPKRVRPPVTDFSHGDTSSYSNYGASLAGLIVANVSGMSYEEYIEKNIFAPLTMTSSTFRQPLPAELNARLSIGYSWENFAAKKHDFAWMDMAPAGNLSSTATDMAKFMLAHLNNGELNGNRILKEESAKLMHARVFSPEQHVNGSGLGFYETWINGHRIIGHGGDLAYFHSDLWLLPDAKVGIFVSYNSAASSMEFSQRDDLIEAVMDRYFPAQIPQVEAPQDFKTRVDRYAGHYRVIRHSYTTLEKLLSPALDLTVAPTADNTLVVKLSFADELADQYVEIAPGVFRRKDHSQTLAFIDNPQSGRTDLTGFIVFHPAYKLKWYETFAWNVFVLGFGALCFLIAIVSALRNRKRDREGDPSPLRARRFAAVVGVLGLGFLITLLVTGIVYADEIEYAWPTSIYVALALPLIAIPFTAALVWFALKAWGGGWWTFYGRLQYTIIAAMSVAFLLTLNFFNLVGYKFG